eukprot:scaffold8033_cov267-Pinguiococcus_pyrenoidosus.AAC.3
MSSLWLGQYYYVFGFLFMVLIILLVTCAETSIVFCYFQLCNEDYRWWWRSFLVPGSTGLYVFLYSCMYFARLEANLTVTYFLYFGYMALVSGGIALVTGTAGFAACLWFTRKIYSSIKAAADASFWTDARSNKWRVLPSIARPTQDIWAKSIVRLGGFGMLREGCIDAMHSVPRVRALRLL